MLVRKHKNMILGHGHKRQPVIGQMFGSSAVLVKFEYLLAIIIPRSTLVQRGNPSQSSSNGSEFEAPALQPCQAMDTDMQDGNSSPSTAPALEPVMTPQRCGDTFFLTL